MSGPRGLRSYRSLRRAALALLILLAALFLARGWVFVRVARGFRPGQPQDLTGQPPDRVADLIERVVRGVDPARAFDFHVHVVGLGTDESGCSVNPRLLSPLAPADWVRGRVFLAAAEVDPSDEHADRAYFEHLLALVEDSPLHTRLGLLAFDRHWRPDGTADEEATEFQTPNAWVERLASLHPDRFVPIASVHPYRPDALDELERVAARGTKIVKWLPNAMGIDPADPRCDPFYDRMVALDLVLLTHGGEEQAVESARDQALGSPLRLRRPLERGVRVIVAHCASLGTSVDSEDPRRPRVANFDLFLRLMDDPRYDGRLWGEISAVTLVNRDRRVLATLLARSDLHRRLVNGSDYPVAAIRALVSLRLLRARGFLAPEDVEPLDEIRDANPLFFDFALKRCLRDPQSGRGFPASVFEAPPELLP